MPNTKPGCGVLLGILLIIPLISAFSAWIVMLVWGAVAASLGWPTLSFFQTWGIMFILGVIGSSFRGGSVNS